MESASEITNPEPIKDNTPSMNEEIPKKNEEPAEKEQIHKSPFPNLISNPEIKNSISTSDIESYLKNYDSNPMHNIIQNVLAKNKITKVIKINDKSQYNRHIFEDRPHRLLYNARRLLQVRIQFETLTVCIPLKELCFRSEKHQ